MDEVFRLLSTVDTEDPLEPLLEAGLALRLQPQGICTPSGYERALGRITRIARGALDDLSLSLCPGDPQFASSPWAVELRDGDRTYRAHLHASWNRFDPELLLLLNCVLDGRGREERVVLVSDGEADEPEAPLTIVVAGAAARNAMRDADLLVGHEQTHPRVREVAPGRFEDRMHDRPLAAEDFPEALTALLPHAAAEDSTALVAAWVDEVSAALCSDEGTIKCPWLGRFHVQVRTGTEETDPVSRAPTNPVGTPEVRFTPGRVLRERLDPNNPGDEEATVSGGPRRVPEALAELIARRRHDAVFVPGLGKFVLSTLRERIGRDPVTGKTVAIASRSMVHFAPSLSLTRRVEAGRASGA